ncbi:molybdenum cofactor biosynthesis protein C [Exophiala spinifera]|uniref:cyclic pyranopterin monophosphate synthase n=1 Tax=Exophiala spinifera TaxID=91928 RepID=A0A0D2BIZ2_9EURO|nr:molybdenum cofactor biosynthesis protein C [Exophiala spinifera]KIW18893.1 molybdenum cofactor biosynthesis protein C [Exophiala spinifera]
MSRIHWRHFSSSPTRSSAFARRWYHDSAPQKTGSRRVLSKNTFRYIRCQGDFRFLPTSEPENIPSFRSHTWSEARARVKTRKLSSQENVRHSSSSSSSEFDKDPPELNHLTTDGEAHMVSISGKVPTRRSATATTVLLFSDPQTYRALLAARLRKGDAIAVARIAGIQAAKKTADLIPLAHPGLCITGVRVHLEPFMSDQLPKPFTAGPLALGQDALKYGGVAVTATVDCEGKTGVEMEAMSAASVAGLTMYDMLKGVDKAMVLTATRVVAKSGGKSGDWVWDEKSNSIVKVGVAVDDNRAVDRAGPAATPKRRDTKTSLTNAIKADDDADVLRALEQQYHEIKNKKIASWTSHMQREIDNGVLMPNIHYHWARWPVTTTPPHSGSGSGGGGGGGRPDTKEERRASSTTTTTSSSPAVPNFATNEQHEQAEAVAVPVESKMARRAGDCEASDSFTTTLLRRGRVGTREFLSTRRQRLVDMLENGGVPLTTERGSY